MVGLTLPRYRSTYAWLALVALGTFDGIASAQIASTQSAAPSAQGVVTWTVPLSPGASTNRYTQPGLSNTQVGPPYAGNPWPSLVPPRPAPTAAATTYQAHQPYPPHQLYQPYQSPYQQLQPALQLPGGWPVNTAPPTQFTTAPYRVSRSMQEPLLPPPAARPTAPAAPQGIDALNNGPTGSSSSTAGDDLLGGDDLLVPRDTSLSRGGGDDDLLTPDAKQSTTENPLDAMGQQPPGRASDSLPGAGHGKDKPDRSTVPAGSDPHADAFADTLYPSALRCAKCHQKIYDEWRVSAHAYAAVSPMFQRFEQAMTVVTKGTVGTFCMRCHAPVATQMSYPREASIADGAAVFREGITCVACHRVVERYGRVNGERRIEPGNIFQPVVGNIGGDGIARVAADADNYKVKLHPGDKRPGQELHQGAIKFEQLGQSSFCVSCHQVAVHPGIALEVVWAQYRASPARARGVTCQDCHMGIEPGKAQGYSCGPAAEMSGKVVDQNRKHSNHMFHGPGNPIAHPGIFPHNEKSLRWSIEQWLEFDWRAGWGTPEFEKQIAAIGGAKDCFPKAWQLTDDRRDARKILDDNFKLLDLKREMATRTMNNAACIEGPEILSSRRLGEDLHVKYRIHNTSDGHNMPTGSLGAQPQLWLNVVLTGPDGKWLWESGFLDGNGDLADMHSLQVRKGLIKPDLQLMNLQTKFLITGVKGTDREMYLPVNVDQDQLPFLRPGAVPVSVLNHPPLVRMEAHSVPPLGFRVADYRIPGELLRQPGTYRLSARMRSRMEPIYFMRFCTATPEMERRMLEQTLDVAPGAVEFEVY